MKLVYIGSKDDHQVKNFRVRRELKNFIKDFDKVEDEDLLMEVKMKETIYWDYCPYDMDIGNGKQTFVWGLEKDALSEYIHQIAQDI
ncbi:hypothetical protein HPMBJEAJ_00205 [Aeromonas phage avDM6]|nr:hypothetical protein HPMBJEAJ_00205 [Aeromonas phage avDM6]